MKELTILMPCLNEVETVGICIERAKKLIRENGIEGEIVVVDNGSTDGSRQVALAADVRVVHCDVRGYGASLQYGIEHAEGVFVLMGDSDDSYHFDEAMPMIDRLRNGYDVCMGSRIKGKIMPNAMPWLNRYIGNPALTFTGRLFFNIALSDFHCGMRAFRREKILNLNLVTSGMEWATEMIIKARMAGLSMTEVPITLYKDGRGRPPHLRRWRDGWRHLRFMLLHSPKWLFFMPGTISLILGLSSMTILAHGVVQIGRIRFDVHSLLVMSFLLIAGVQMIFTGIFAKLYSHMSGIIPSDEKFERTVRRLTLEKLLVISLLLGSLGIAGFLYTLSGWYKTGFSNLDYRITMRQLIPSLTMIALSVQGAFNGFMLSVLFLKVRCPRWSPPE